MTNIGEKLEDFFFNNIDLCDQKFIKLISLDDDELEKKYIEEPQLFKEYLFTTHVEEPDTESDSEQPPPNIKMAKFEKMDDDSEDSDVDQAESSFQGGNRNKNKKKNTEFRMPTHKGIPNSQNKATPIDVLNLDCVSDLDEREEIIKKWATEISLIIQTNEEDFKNSKAVLTLIEHKTSGIVQKQVKLIQWNMDLHGHDFFRGFVNMFYTVFLGKDYLGNELAEITKKAEIARGKLTKLQLLDICHLDEFTCIYEKNLYDIPDANEYEQWIIAYLMKLPVIGEQCLVRWRTEAIHSWSKMSLALATKIAKEEITKICTERFKQRKLKNVSLNCCKTVGNFQDLTIGKDKKSYYKKKYKKKYKTSWKKKTKKFSPGKYFKKPTKQTYNKPPDKNCPQGKKKCRCWICSEEGHYANECPNRSKYPDKIRMIKVAIDDGYEPVEDIYDGEETVLKITIEDSSDESD